MTRVKLIMLGLLAALVVSAVGSASASAICTRTNPTHWVWCDHTNAELGTPPVLFLGLGKLQLLRGIITGVEAEFHCKDVHVHGFIELLGLGKVSLLYLGCKMVRPAKCKLTEKQELDISTLPNLVFHTIGALPGGPPRLLVLGAGANKAFATLETEAPTGCTVPAGKYEVTGEQAVELPEPESFKAEHEFVSLVEEPSKLKLGGNEAFYEGSALIHLASGLPFAVLPGI